MIYDKPKNEGNAPGDSPRSKKGISDYAYGWMHYRAVKPSGIKMLNGKDHHETIKVYNASARFPEMSLSIKGTVYSFVTAPPEPDENPDFKPGDYFWVPLTKDEIKHLVKGRIEEMAKRGVNRGQRRRAEKVLTDQLKTKNVVKQIESLPENE